MWLIVDDGADAMTCGNGRVRRGAEVNEKGLVRLAESVAIDLYDDGYP